MIQESNALSDFASFPFVLSPAWNPAESLTNDQPIC
jgi:hypothetical protein